MRNEFAKWEIKTSVFSGRKSQAGNCWAGLIVPLVSMEDAVLSKMTGCTWEATGQSAMLPRCGSAAESSIQHTSAYRR